MTLYNGPVGTAPTSTSSFSPGWTAGNTFTLSADCWLTQIGAWKDANPGNVMPMQGAVWASGNTTAIAGTTVTIDPSNTAATGAMAYADLPAPVFLAAGTYIVGTLRPTGTYAQRTAVLSSNVTSGPLTFTTATPYASGGTLAYPNTAFGDGRYWYSDVTVSDVDPAGGDPLTVAGSSGAATMPPAMTSGATGTAGTFSSITLAPSGAAPAAGDTRIIFITATATTITVPSGWTTHYNGTQGSHTLCIASRVFQAADGNAVFSFSASVAHAYQIAKIINGDQASIQIAVAGGTSSVNNVAPTITPVLAGSLLFTFHAIGPITTGGTTATLSTPAGMTAKFVAKPTTATGHYCATFGQTQTGVTATGTRTSVGSTAGVWRAASLIIQPAQPGVPVIDAYDNFAGGLIDTAMWPERNLAAIDPRLRALELDAAYSGGVLYSLLRSQYAYKLLGSGSTFSAEMRQLPAGNANAQMWLQSRLAAVGRVGFEYRASANQLDFIAQGAAYATLGTTVTVTRTRAHRWCMLTLDSTNGLQWWTTSAPQTWVLRRTLTYAQVQSLCPWLLRGDLAMSFEAFRNAAGTTDEFVVDNINYPLPTEPTWAPAMTGGSVLWVADMAQADSVAAGYTDDSYQRQTASGPMGDTTVPFPVPMLPAPFGRSGRAMRLRIPDVYRRYEVVPDVPALVDGNEVFIGFSVFIEADTDIIATAGNYYQSIWQLRPDDSTGSPPVSMEVIEGKLELTGGYGRPDPAGGADFTNQAQYRQTLLNPMPKGVWVDIVIYLAMWSALNSGRVDVWVNGTQVLANFRPPPGTNFGTAAETAYPKNGIYHDGSNRGATVWFADHKHGTSYAAVDPNRAISEWRDVMAEP